MFQKQVQFFRDQVEGPVRTAGTKRSDTRVGIYACATKDTQNTVIGSWAQVEAEKFVVGFAFGVDLHPPVSAGATLISYCLESTTLCT